MVSMSEGCVLWCTTVFFREDGHTGWCSTLYTLVLDHRTAGLGNSSTDWSVLCMSDLISSNLVALACQRRPVRG